MSRNNSKTRTFSSWWERSYPFLVSLALCTVFYFVGFSTKTTNIDKLVDASINLASIVVGLLGALLGILISIKDAAVVKLVFNSGIHRDTVFKFIRYPIFAAFLAIIMGCVLYTFIGPHAKQTWTSDIIFWIWVFCCLNILVASYRVIDILMYLLSVKDVTVERPPGNEMNSEEVQRLKEQLTRKPSH